MAQAWGVARIGNMIINLPATVEMATPNIYADQIEWFCRNLPERPYVAVSLHTHNDRGTGHSNPELACRRGPGGGYALRQRRAHRQRGSGHAGHEYVLSGVDPEIDLSDMRRVRSVVESCNKLPVHERHPYAGDLVFDGSSSAATRTPSARGMNRVRRTSGGALSTHRPRGRRHYRETVRVNSQSGMWPSCSKTSFDTRTLTRNCQGGAGKLDERGRAKGQTFVGLGLLIAPT